MFGLPVIIYINRSKKSGRRWGNRGRLSGKTIVRGWGSRTRQTVSASCLIKLYTATAEPMNFIFWTIASIPLFLLPAAVARRVVRGRQRIRRLLERGMTISVADVARLPKDSLFIETYLGFGKEVWWVIEEPLPGHRPGRRLLAQKRLYPTPSDQMLSDICAHHGFRFERRGVKLRTAIEFR